MRLKAWLRLSGTLTGGLIGVWLSLHGGRSGTGCHVEQRASGGHEVELTLRASNETGGAGVTAVVVEYSRDGVTWLLGAVEHVEPAAVTVERSVHFRLQRAAGTLRVRAVAEDGVGCTSAPAQANGLTVPCMIHLPLVMAVE